MATVALVSFRLGGTDGVSLEAARWVRSLRRLGHTTTTVAGAGRADVLVPGLAWPPPAERPPVAVGSLVDEVAAVVGGADVVVVENVCSLPLVPTASSAVATALAGRPAVIHHYDLPWERPGPPVAGWPPTDPAWAHVTITDHARRGLADRGVSATTIRPTVETGDGPGDRRATRAGLGLGTGDRLVLHPVRAIPRKDVPAAVALAEALGATYWLTGPAEEGYGPTLAAVLAAARCPTRHRPVARVADAYAACDVVALPSTWEGFGLPLGEAALHRRPVVAGRFPAADELGALGFRFLPADDVPAVVAALDRPDEGDLDANEALARRHLGPERLDEDLSALLTAVGA